MPAWGPGTLRPGAAGKRFCCQGEQRKELTQRSGPSGSMPGIDACSLRSKGKHQMGC